MRVKTVLGVLLLIGVAIAAGVASRRSMPGTSGEENHDEVPLVSRSTSAGPASRGAIVPLREREPAAAFIAPNDDELESGQTETGGEGGRVVGVPAIRRDNLLAAQASPPTLRDDYPMPLLLLGIGHSTWKVNEDLHQVPLTNTDSSSAGHTVLRHKIVDGDTLAQLAQRYLGDATQADVIFRANRGVLTSADLLPIGAEIVIPAKDDAGAQ